MIFSFFLKLTFLALVAIINQIQSAAANSLTKWKASEEGHYFVKKDDQEWVEFQKDAFYAKFRFIMEQNDVVFLFAQDRNFYISLDAKEAKWGDNLNSLPNVFNTGNWVKQEGQNNQGVNLPNQSAGQINNLISQKNPSASFDLNGNKIGSNIIINIQPQGTVSK
ncbi:unnamed protein product [Brachionus calyciflorus]|uniref:Uncharacterized protein n=1 Tax=Brachionus calyciflorus TaxID=104777 RepID=A0A814D1Q7_9BILA|nr:unnamed protein product [Brachionus calyciflorus]